jgi:hypothetical protein
MVLKIFQLVIVIIVLMLSLQYLIVQVSNRSIQAGIKVEHLRLCLYERVGNFKIIKCQQLSTDPHD